MNSDKKVIHLLLTIAFISTIVQASVSGTVYHDINHNSRLDNNEAGTGLVLHVKIVSSLLPDGPALGSVPADPITGEYQFLIAIDPGKYNLILDDNPSILDVTPTVPPGWLGTETPEHRRQGVTVLVGGLKRQNFGLFNGSKVVGAVFADTGEGGGIANNSNQDGEETGIANVSLRATNSDASVVFDTTTTNPDGSYVLWIPLAASIVKIVETDLKDYFSIGGSVGNTGGSYDRDSDTTTFTNFVGSVYTEVNFADVPHHVFTYDNQRNAPPNSIVFFRHTFLAGTAGTVNFMTINIANPEQDGWNHVLYRDVDCDGELDSGELPLTSSIAVVAEERICLLVKQFIPSEVPQNSSNRIIITPVFTYTPTLIASVEPNSDLTIAVLPSGDLKLFKSVSKEQAQPGDILTYTIVYINVGVSTAKNIVLSDPISPFCELQRGVFPDGKDILWRKPDGTDSFLTASVDGDEGSFEDGMLVVQMKSAAIPPGISGMIQYQVVVK